MPARRAAIAASASALLAPLLVLPLAGTAASAGERDHRHWHGHEHPLASSIAVSWQRTAIRTIYTEGRLAPPEGALYLAFTSLAVHDAAVEAQRHGTHAAAAAVATAAHDVLRQYFSGSAAALDADLAASLATVPDGRKEAAGVSIGAAAAADMIASRVGDGRNNPSYKYEREEAAGVWQPPAGGAMALPWLGFVTKVIDVRSVRLDGPDTLTSAEYARDYEEVRTLGVAVDSAREGDQTNIAQFFSVNPIPVYREAVCKLLVAKPMGLLPTTRLFARIDAAVANALIQTWRLKYEVGFWRPFQAIAGAEKDGNPATQPHPVAWTPLVANPAYSDYTSGHASATAPFAQVMRRTFGDETPLVLEAGGAQRTYATLTALEYDTLNARIWGGLHFRDAMEDGYYLGHKTANRVMRALH